MQIGLISTRTPTPKKNTHKKSTYAHTFYIVDKKRDSLSVEMHKTNRVLFPKKI